MTGSLKAHSIKLLRHPVPQAQAVIRVLKRFQKPAISIWLALVVSLPYFCLPTQAQTSSIEDNETAPSEANPPRTLDTLSTEAQSAAKNLGLWSGLVQYDALREKKRAGGQVGTDYIEARQNLMESVLIVSQDVRTFVHFLEEEIAKADSINAMIAARRDRALRLNTYGDLISGGITGMIGGGLQFGDVTHYSYDTIDTVEGAVQTALALLSLREQRGEKRIEKGIPNILSRLFEPKKGPSPAYPACVWTFLNSSSTKEPGAETRREKLVNEWTKSHFCVTHQHTHGRKVSSLREKRERILNRSTQNYRATAELVEDRIAMLHQLRSTVTRLDVIMLEILLYMRGSSLASTSPTS